MAVVEAETKVNVWTVRLKKRETFTNLENGNKEGEFNYIRSRQLEKQDCLWCLNCVESLLQSLEVRVVREESFCFQVRQQIPL